MENRMAAMILAQPTRFHRHAPRLILAIGMAGKNFPQSCQAFRKISEDFCRDFALVAARPQYACKQDPAWSFGAQWDADCSAVSRKHDLEKVNLQEFPG